MIISAATALLIAAVGLSLPALALIVRPVEPEMPKENLGACQTAVSTTLLTASAVLLAASVSLASTYAATIFCAAALLALAIGCAMQVGADPRSEAFHISRALGGAALLVGLPAVSAFW